MYDEKGNITREGAEQVIRGGGSVSIKGKLYTTVESLPDAVAFAGDEPAAQADARTRLEKQIADAQAQLGRLGPAAGGGGVTEAGKAEGDTSPNAGHRRHAGKS